MKVEALTMLVTIFGLISFMISMFIIFFGKRVGEKSGGLQRIKVGKYVEIGTNSVLMLVLITATFSIAPLALTYLKPEITAKEYSMVLVHGYVVLDDGSPANNVDINVIRLYKQAADTVKIKSGLQGNFMIPLENAKPKEQYEITWSKKGYSDERVSFGFNQIPFPIRLEKGGDN